MSLRGSSLIARLAMNPRCEIQAAMAMSPRSERDFYEAVTGEPLRREYGERQSAKRRGFQFEENLFRPPGDARLLREAVAPYLGTESDRISVRDLPMEIPGERMDSRVKRLQRTREIVKAAVEERNHPQLVIQPQLLIPTASTGKSPQLYIAPDFMAWSPDAKAFIPGDAKSFVVRDNQVEPGDLERARLQLASQVLAMRHEFGRHHAAGRVRPMALLIFATPFGLRPHPAVEEDLSGALAAAERALDAFERHRDRIASLAAGAPEHLVVDELRPHFQEKCLATCAMADYCRRRVAGRVMEVGDAAAERIGREADLERVLALMAGAVEPADEAERRTAEELRRIADEIDPQWRAA